MNALGGGAALDVGDVGSKYLLEVPHRAFAVATGENLTGLEQFRPLLDLYRETWRASGHPAERLFIGVHNIGFLADTPADARETFWPGYRQAFGKIGRERGWPPPTCLRASSSTALVMMGGICSMPSLSSGDSLVGLTSDAGLPP